jgi:hypothetical protein
MFIDGRSFYCYKKKQDGKIIPDKLEGIEFALLREYIEDDFCNRPELTNAIKDYNRALSEADQKRKIGSESAIKYLEEARRKVDAQLSRYEWRAFKRGKQISTSIPPDYFYFDPPKDIKYCLIVPFSIRRKPA